MSKEGYQPLKTKKTIKIIPPNTGSNIQMKKDCYTWEDLDKAWWEGFDNAKSKMEKRITELEMTISKMEKGTCDICKETEKDKKIAELETRCNELFLQTCEQAEKIKELNAELESERDLPAIAYMQGAEKQKKKDEKELQKWKDEWQEQVQKATDEGYARTLQTMQLTKATKIIKELCGMVRELNKPNVQLTNVDYSLAEAEQFIKDSEGK